MSETASQPWGWSSYTHHAWHKDESQSTHHEVHAESKSSPPATTLRELRKHPDPLTTVAPALSSLRPEPADRASAELPFGAALGTAFPTAGEPLGARPLIHLDMGGSGEADVLGGEGHGPAARGLHNLPLPRLSEGRIRGAQKRVECSSRRSCLRTQNSSAHAHRSVMSVTPAAIRNCTSHHEKQRHKRNTDDLATPPSPPSRPPRGHCLVVKPLGSRSSHV